MTRFESYCRRREQAALAARLSGFRTIFDCSSGKQVIGLGNDWTRRLFDGDFYRSAQMPVGLPTVSLVFVQSRAGNTVAADPSTLGGGETDKHLIYEGLSRVDADAVMAGATTARSERIVFSVWHPQLVALRCSRGGRRHPAQVVITDQGDVPIERGLMFDEPSLEVFVVTRSAVAHAHRDRVRDRPWVTIIDAGDPLSPTVALRALRARGIQVISCIGGRRTATALLHDKLVSDVYLTTSPIDAGEPNTPFYEGPPLPLSRVVSKAACGDKQGVRFDHFIIDW